MLLYRFRPFNQHTITELLTEKLHFSHPNTWNDPFEYDAQKEIDSGRLYACFAKNKSDVGEQDVFDNILMWSHYAESHKGICIEYEYRNWKYEPDYRVLSGGVSIRYGQIEGIACKNRCWEYENEFRMVQYAQKDVDLQGVEIPYTEIGLKIKGIFCGVKFEKTQLETLKIIRGERDFAIFTGTVENYNSIKFTNTGAVERT